MRFLYKLNQVSVIMGKELIKDLFTLKDNQGVKAVSQVVKDTAKKLGLEKELEKINELLNNPESVMNDIAGTIKEAIVDPDTIILKLEESKKNLVVLWEIIRYLYSYIFL